MPNPGIFCNSPWYELQIYWDGSLGFCCQERRKPYADQQASVFNIKNMTIKEWFDSQPMRDSRIMMFGDKRNDVCSRCYHEEDHSGNSRRHRSNLKSAIFTRMNFADSYQQSPGFDKFESSYKNSGAYGGMPIDLHINLGNYCNLACKMCAPRASSRIAAQHVKWGIKEAEQYIGTDWTRDQTVWDRVCEELRNIPNLKNIHFMGGETLITKRFEDFVDYMLAHNRTDLNFSFVTNGTTFNSSLMSKLLKFQRVGIEISVETLTEHNSYQRQGTDQALLHKNINQYLEICDNDRITVSIRPAISILTIGQFSTLLQWCLDKKLIIKSLMVTRPLYLDPVILPDSIKDLYLDRYHKFLELNDLEHDDLLDYNESNQHQLRRVIRNQARRVMSVLSTPAPADADEKLKLMVKHCRDWDIEFGLDARKLYPEFSEILNQYGY